MIKIAKVPEATHDIMPTRGTDLAAAIDLKASIRGNIRAYNIDEGREFVVMHSGPQVLLHAGNVTYMIPTGIMVEMPDNVAMVVLPRSGLAAKSGVQIVNSPGLIDPDYRGEIVVAVRCHADILIKNGDRIAQGMFTPFFSPEKIEFVLPDSLTKTARGEGGFGSTGV